MVKWEWQCPWDSAARSMLGTAGLSPGTAPAQGWTLQAVPKERMEIGLKGAPSDSHDPERVQGDKSHCWGHERGDLCSHKRGPAAGTAVFAGARPGHRSQLGPGAQCQGSLERVLITNSGGKTPHKNTAKAAGPC